MAICLLHSYLNPQHEIRLRELVREVLGDVEVSISSEVSPHVREYTRSTTTTDRPADEAQVPRVHPPARGGTATRSASVAQFNYADCSAMLMPAAYAMERPHKLVVGGPAAGTVACAHFGSTSTRTNLLCADVGGTSCDISAGARRPAVGERHVRARVGSRGQRAVDRDRRPSARAADRSSRSARRASSGSAPTAPGADPGPACYGKGGTAPTITDAAVAIGILDPDRFVGGKVPLHPDLALGAFEALDTSLPLSERIRQAWLIGLHNIAEGIIDIAIRRGLDVRDLSLDGLRRGRADDAPGTARPPAAAERHRAAEPRRVQCARTAERRPGVLREPHPSRHPHGRARAPRSRRCSRRSSTVCSSRPGVSAEEATIRRTFDGRLLGQGWETPFVPVPTGPLGAKEIEQMIEAFHAEYEQRNGHRFAAFPVEGVTYRVQLVVPSDKVRFEHRAVRRAGELDPRATAPARRTSTPAVRVTAACYERDDLLAGDVVRARRWCGRRTRRPSSRRGASARSGPTANWW